RRGVRGHATQALEGPSELLHLVPEAERGDDRPAGVVRRAPGRPGHPARRPASPGGDPGRGPEVPAGRGHPDRLHPAAAALPWRLARPAAAPVLPLQAGHYPGGRAPVTRTIEQRPGRLR
ncbi:hypothetical protein, partial [Rouxiella badensis]|uniref:hypothetical protein n=1 Tax=Rouxiella badensis TaxID=1646377 RepID=UPI003C75F4E2